jgi:hypothetical protein
MLPAPAPAPGGSCIGKYNHQFKGPCNFGVTRAGVFVNDAWQQSTCLMLPPPG